MNHQNNELYISHYDDKKEKDQSHEMRILGNRIDESLDYNVWLSSYDIGDINVYGKTKEECKKNLILAVDEVVNKLVDFREKLHNDQVEIIDI